MQAPWGCAHAGFNSLSKTVRQTVRATQDSPWRGYGSHPIHAGGEAMTRTQSALKQLALAAALGALVASPVAMAQHQGHAKGHAKHEQKAQKEYRKAVHKAQKAEAKAYKRWAKGQHIPREYVVERYYITDYQAYDLAPPPVGYQYIQPYPQDDTYYLVQLASGLISQIFN